MRPVFFAKYFEKGSTIVGADQTSDGLRRRGHEASSISSGELGGIRDAIVVFIKRSSLLDVVRLKLRGNRLALDVQDRLVFKRRLRNRFALDAVIFRNRRQLRDYGRQPEDRLIYQHWDPRYRPHEAGHDELRLGYFGIERSLELWGKLPDVTFVSEDWWEETPRFNAHLSIRRPGREHRYKPNTKVSTAAACRAVLLTTPDESSRELLGDDYPFYTEADRGSVVESIRGLKEAVGGSRWHEALRRLERVRERTSMDAVLDRYEEFLEGLS